MKTLFPFLYPVIMVFLFLYFGWRMFKSKESIPKKLLETVIFIILIALIFFAVYLLGPNSGF